MCQESALCMAKSVECQKPNHFKAVCRSVNKQQPDQEVRGAAHEVSQEGELQSVKQENQDISFVAVSIKFINLGSMKYVIFTKLKSSMSQRQN